MSLDEIVAHFKTLRKRLEVLWTRRDGARGANAIKPGYGVESTAPNFETGAGEIQTTRTTARNIAGRSTRSQYGRYRQPISPADAENAEAIRKAIAKLRAAKDENERDTAATSLTKLLETAFDRDYERRNKELLQLEARVTKLRAQMDRRKKSRDDIIQVRVKSLLYEAEGIGFTAGLGIQQQDPRKSPPHFQLRGPESLRLWPQRRDQLRQPDPSRTPVLPSIEQLPLNRRSDKDEGHEDLPNLN